MSTKITTVVIPVAGKGTRFLPVTKVVNKTLFPIINKPTIQYLLEEGLNAGIKHFILIINEEQLDIKDYLNLNSPYYKLLSKHYSDLDQLDEILSNIKIDYVIQDKLDGLGGAISRCKNLIKDDAFAVMLGDDLVLHNKENVYGIESLIKEYEKLPGYYLGVNEVDPKFTYKYGIIKKEGNKVIGIVEKPKSNPPSNFACVGRYILKNNVFDYLEKVRKDDTGEIQLTDALALAIKNENVYSNVFGGERFDIGDHAGFVKATIRQALNDPAISNDVYDYIQEVEENWKRIS